MFTYEVASDGALLISTLSNDIPDRQGGAVRLEVAGGVPSHVVDTILRRALEAVRLLEGEPVARQEQHRFTSLPPSRRAAT